MTLVGHIFPKMFNLELVEITNNDVIGWIQWWLAIDIGFILHSHWLINNAIYYLVQNMAILVSGFSHMSSLFENVQQIYWLVSLWRIVIVYIKIANNGCWHSEASDVTAQCFWLVYEVTLRCSCSKIYLRDLRTKNPHVRLWPFPG